MPDDFSNRTFLALLMSVVAAIAFYGLAIVGSLVFRLCRWIILGF